MIFLVSAPKQSALFVHASLVLQLFSISPNCLSLVHNSTFLCHPRQVTIRPLSLSLSHIIYWTLSLRLWAFLRPLQQRPISTFSFSFFFFIYRFSFLISIYKIKWNKCNRPFHNKKRLHIPPKKKNHNLFYHSWIMKFLQIFICCILTSFFYLLLTIHHINIY